MAASVSSGDDDVVSDINITPLVDVVLVLLIVFMVTAPALSSLAIFKINLPSANTVSTATPDKLPLTLEARRGPGGNVELYLNDASTTEEDLRAYFTEALENPDEQTITVKADETLTYGEVARVLDMLASMRMSKISLVTKHVDSI